MTRSDLALAALATAAVPGMKPVSVTGVRPASDQPTPRYQVAFIEDATGRTWVVRAPLDAAGGAELERNDTLIRMLGRHLPFKVPAAAGYADLGPAGRAAVYPYVEGSALNFRTLPAGPGLTAAVGRAVAAVHNIQRDLFEEAGTPVFDAAAYRTRRLADLDRAAETGHVPTGLLTRWEQALEAPALWQFSTTATHGSLDGGSFLVAFSGDDAATGRVVALTGWENAQVADPADDFAALVRQASPAVVDAVLESYSMARSQRPDGYLVHRARLASELALITGLARAVDSEDDETVRDRAERLRKLDRLTSVDDSLVPRTALVETAPAAAAPSTPSSDVTGPVDGEAAGEAAAEDEADAAAGGRGSTDSLETGVVEVSDRGGAWQTVPHTGEEDPANEARADEDLEVGTEDRTEEIPVAETPGSDDPDVAAEVPTTEDTETETPAADEAVTGEDPSDEPPRHEPSPPAAEEVSPTTSESPAEEERERLHTLYGMPTEGEPASAEDEPAGTDDDPGEAEDEPGEDAADPDDPTDDADSPRQEGSA